METKKANKKCRSIRVWLCQAVSSHIGLNADWVQNHIANCPRCRQRLAAVGKVSLALSIIKSQPHNLDLLMRSNAQAIGVLKHSLRNCRKAQKLKKLLPEPKLLERCGKYRLSLVNTREDETTSSQETEFPPDRMHFPEPEVQLLQVQYGLLQYFYLDPGV